MKRKELEDLGLEKDVIDTIMKINGADIEAAKGDVTALQKQVETLEATVKERDGQIETLGKSTGDVEAMKKQIETLQVENTAASEKYATDLKNIKVETAITAAGGLIPAAIKALIDVSKVEVQADGSLKGLSEQLDTMKKDVTSKILFKTEETKKPAVKGAKTGETGVEGADGAVKADDFKTYEELAAYMEANPDAVIE